MGKRVPEHISEGWGPRWAPLPGKGGSHSASAPSTQPPLGCSAVVQAQVGTPPHARGAPATEPQCSPPPNPHPAKEPSRGTSTRLFAFQTTAVPAVARQKFRAWRPPHIPKPSFPSPGLLLLGTELGPGVPPVPALPLCPHPNVHPVFQPVRYFIYSLPPGTVPPNTDQWCWMGGLRQPPAQHPQHPHTHPCEPGPIAAPPKTPPSSPPQALRHRLLPPEQTYTSPAE